LPPPVVRFVQELQVTLKPSTCYGYAGNLRRFHSWLEERGVAPRDLERRHVVDWLVHLNKQQLHPSTRYAIIIQIRVYLRWLADQQELHNEPETLLTVEDCPKLPQYLPRPFPPDVDRQLQQRLEQSGDRYQLGLLLMRNTGIRIGELMDLPLDCISADHLDNQFLKVPLGKLNNERLVPIDDKTSHLIARLRSIASPAKPWLLQTPSSCKTYYDLYSRALREACQGLHIGGRVTTHRLRHTYATALLSGGMSLVGIMKLLGHRTVRMTLRYADITEETVGREYREALAVAEKRYPTPERFQHNAGTDPHVLLAEVIRWLQDDSTQISPNQAKARNLVRRIKRLQADLAALTP